jgi:hypothetical protein
LDIGNPIALSPSKTLMFALPIESRSNMLQLREVEILKGLRIDHRVDVTVNGACHHWNNAAFGANVELSGAGCKGVDG